MPRPPSHAYWSRLPALTPMSYPRRSDSTRSINAASSISRGGNPHHFTANTFVCKLNFLHNPLGWYLQFPLRLAFTVENIPEVELTLTFGNNRIVNRTSQLETALKSNLHSQLGTALKSHLDLLHVMVIPATGSMRWCSSCAKKYAYWPPICSRHCTSIWAPVPRLPMSRGLCAVKLLKSGYSQSRRKHNIFFFTLYVCVCGLAVVPVADQFIGTLGTLMIISMQTHTSKETRNSVCQ